MTQLIDQPDSTTGRKVRWGATASSLAAPTSFILAMWIVSRVDLPPVFDADAFRMSLEVAISSLLSGLTTWATGYYTRAEAGEVGQ